MWTLRDLFRMLLPGYEDRYRQQQAQRMLATPGLKDTGNTLEELFRHQQPMLSSEFMRQDGQQRRLYLQDRIDHLRRTPDMDWFKGIQTPYEGMI